MNIFTLTNKILSFLLIIIFWFILSKIYPPIVVPSVRQVWESIKGILLDITLLKEILTTIIRLFIGFSFGLIFSIIFSLIITRSKLLGDIFYPIIEFTSSTTNKLVNFSYTMVRFKWKTSYFNCFNFYILYYDYISSKLNK